MNWLRRLFGKRPEQIRPDGTRCIVIPLKLAPSVYPAALRNKPRFMLDDDVPDPPPHIPDDAA